MLLALLAAPAFAAAPTASNGSASVAEDNSVNVTLSATDPEGQAMTYSVVGGPANGSVTIAGNVATYTPTANYNGSDSFTWRARDTARQNSNVATVSVTVRAINDPPTGGSSTVATAENTAATFTLPGSDVDGDALTWSIASAPAQGTVTVTPSTGRAVYTPPASYAGATTFRYQVSDGARTAGGVVTVTVENGNDAPVAVAQSTTIAEDSGTVSLTLVGTDADGDPLTYAIASGPSHGTVGLNNRLAVYAPEANFYGTDTFTFTVNDGTVTSAPGTVTITVTAVNDPPVVLDTAGMTDGRSIQLFTYASDIDGTPRAPTIVGAPTHGRAWMTGSNVRYTPDTGFVGMDHVTIRVSDGTDTTDADVKISVLGTPLGAQAGWAQVGVNSIPFYGDATTTPDTASPQLQGSYILDDLYDIGIQSYRQLRSADVTWDAFEPSDGNIVDLDTADLFGLHQVEARATVFAYNFASPTPPWAASPSDFKKSMTPRAYAYLDEVIARYGDQIRYWEVGNEMFHWVSVDTPPADPSSIPGLPAAYPLDGYSPEEQGEFLRDASNYIRSMDPDAVIVLSSVLPDSAGTADWITRVVDHTGSDWFDVVTYHSYEEWDTLRRQRRTFATLLTELGLDDKLVQLTETGTSAYSYQTAKTDYPNSPTTQASDVFRLLIPAYAAGDSAVIWHTYRELSEADTGTYGGMGLFDYDTSARPAAYAMQLLSTELLPIVQVTDLTDGDAYVYEVRTQGGTTSRVMWGSGTLSAPSGFTTYTSVMPALDGSFTWRALGSTITLSDTPILVQ